MNKKNEFVSASFCRFLPNTQTSKFHRSEYWNGGHRSEYWNGGHRSEYWNGGHRSEYWNGGKLPSKRVLELLVKYSFRQTTFWLRRNKPALLHRHQLLRMAWLAWMCVLQKVLPAVVTVVEQVSSNMRQSLPTFQKELLNVIHMNSTHSDQVKQHY